jgi:hypothetical protein
MEGQQTMWREIFLPGAFYVARTLMIGLPNYILFFIV